MKTYHKEKMVLAADEANLQKYLRAETALNVFFARFNYCFLNCVAPELEKNGGHPVSACCRDRYYEKYDLDHPAFYLLRQEREKLYGRPDTHKYPGSVSPCEYHHPETGCILFTHKSPICLAFMCRESIECLRDTYGIYAYDYLGVNYALEWILTGTFSDKDYHEFMEMIQSMISTVSPGR